MKSVLNTIETTDDYLQLFGSTEWTPFYTYEDYSSTATNPSLNLMFGTHDFLTMSIELKEQQKSHSRQIYGILDLFGDFGGLKEVVTLVLELIVAPWAEHIFTLTAIKKLFLVSNSRKVMQIANSSEETDPDEAEKAKSSKKGKNK